MKSPYIIELLTYGQGPDKGAGGQCPGATLLVKRRIKRFGVLAPHQLHHWAATPLQGTRILWNVRTREQTIAR